MTRTLYIDEDFSNISLNSGVSPTHTEVYFTDKYHPNYLSWVSHMQYFWLLENGQENPGVLVTTPRNKLAWGCLPPEIEVVVWKGTPMPQMSLPEVALVHAGLPLKIAKDIVKRKKFVTGGDGKYAEEIQAAVDWLVDARYTFPKRIFIRQPKELRQYVKMDDLGPHNTDVTPIKPMAFDIETTGLDPMKDRLVGVSVCYHESVAIWIPCPKGVIPQNLAAELADATITKITNGGKFDIKFLKAKGYEVRGVEDDTELMAYTLQLARPYKLKSLAHEILDEEVTTFQDIVPEGKTFEDVDEKTQIAYACQDANLTFMLWQELRRRFDGKPNLFGVYKQIEVPLMRILADMELAGSPVNLQEARKLLRSTEKEVAVLEQAMWDEAGETFDPKKPSDLRYILFEKLGLNPVRETKTGYAMDKFTLEVLAKDSGLVQLILEWRKRQTLLGTYLIPLVNSYKDDAEYERIHGAFNQDITVTGRLSSSHPNLQNQAPLVRGAYAVPTGRLLIASDYSQQELRLMAHMSQDKRMLDAFTMGEDIHAQTAQLLRIPRKIAKNVNFGLAYGAGPRTLARTAKCSVQEAAQILNQHHHTYPDLWAWIEWQKQLVHSRGYGESIRGRRRMLPKVYSNLPEDVSAAEREGVNMAVQGSAADVTKMAMLNVDKVLDPKCRLIMQVHDELVFELLEPTEVDFYETMIRTEMERVADELGLSVPLPVDIHHGQNWKELKG